MNALKSGNRSIFSSNYITNSLFYFKNVELDSKDDSLGCDVAFEYEIIGGNYRDHGYGEEQEYLNRVITDKNRDQFKVELGKILNNLLVLNDPRVILHKGRMINQ